MRIIAKNIANINSKKFVIVIVCVLQRYHFKSISYGGRKNHQNHIRYSMIPDDCFYSLSCIVQLFQKTRISSPDNMTPKN